MGMDGFTEVFFFITDNHCYTDQNSDEEMQNTYAEELQCYHRDSEDDFK